jgi:hypothetical protein
LHAGSGAQIIEHHAVRSVVYLCNMRVPGKVVIGAVAILGAAACVFLAGVAAGRGVGQASLWAGLFLRWRGSVRWSRQYGGK